LCIKEKELSCGGLIYSTNNEILITRSTNNKYWNIPKGIIEKDETPLQCAIREIKEETNIDVSSCLCIDIGEHEYLSYKNLHLFIFVLHHIPVDIKCNSIFLTKKGISLPEISDFKWCRVDEAKLLWSPNFMNTINSVIKYVKDSKLYYTYSILNGD